jgi:methionyl aminopeptidase
MSIRVIQHDNWKFDYDTKSNVYNITSDLIDSRHFSFFNEISTPDNNILDYRKASSIHKIVRNDVVKKFKPGAKIKDLVNYTENLILKLSGNNRESYFNKFNNAGIAFPVGMSINNCIAHDSALIKDNRYLEENDILKFDFGVHNNGNIIDAALTHIVGEEKQENNIYYPLLEASKESVYSAISMARPDSLLFEISEIISEIINSYEIALDNNSNYIPIVPVNGIGGHNILPYQIHGEKFIFSVPNEQIQGNMRMDENEIYAIETYATTGNGNMTQGKNIDTCSHFMLNNLKSNQEIKKFKKDKNSVYNQIKYRNGLPFTLSWYDTQKNQFNRFLKKGIMNNDIIVYPPLYDKEKSKVAQFEHTIKINESKVEIFTLGNDY